MEEWSNEESATNVCSSFGIDRYVFQEAEQGSITYSLFQGFRVVGTGQRVVSRKNSNGVGEGRESKGTLDYE